MGRAKIAGYDFEVIVNSEMRGLCGACNAASQNMYVHDRIHDQAKISTIWHEMLETINTIFELGLEHNQIQSLETATYGALVDNGIDLSPLLELLEPESEGEESDGAE